MAKFAPNLTMGFGKHLYISNNNPFATHIVFYGHYIDDIVIIWDGPVHTVYAFAQHYNNNTLGLCFTYVQNPDILAFLRVG